MRRGMLMALALVVGCTGNGNGSLRVTGQIEGVDVDVGSRVGGRVAEVCVREGDRVAKGDVLLRLEDDEARALVSAAQAKVAQTEAALQKLETGARPEEIAQAEAAAQRAEEQYRMAQSGARDREIAAARDSAAALQAQRDAAKKEYDRLERLYTAQAVSQQMRDGALHAYEAAQAQMEAADEKAKLLVEGTRAEEVAMAKAAYDQARAALEEVKTGPRREDIEQGRAARDAARAELARAESSLKEMQIAAPMDAVVESLDIRPGDLVKPGPVARLVDPNKLELVVYVSAAMLGGLRVGQTVPLTADGLEGEQFEGTIIRIATQGEYTPRNLQTEEERVQQVFGVKLSLDSHGGKLKAGMSATAHLHPVSEGGAA